jgi:uncharacterized damage-inducible protein DinB
MNKQALAMQWDHLRQQYGIYLRLIESIPEASLHTHPVPGIRTPAEMVVHVSGTVIRDIARGVAKGRIETDESADGAKATSLGSKAALLDFARTCWHEADAAVRTIDDAHLNAMVPTPWNRSFPGWVAFAILSEEFVHHRGQLSVFARLCGGQPPFIYDFAGNPAGFQPAAAHA